MDAPKNGFDNKAFPYVSCQICHFLGYAFIKESGGLFDSSLYNSDIKHLTIHGTNSPMKNDRKMAGPVKLWDILGRTTPLKFNIDTETKKTYLKGDRYTFQTTIQIQVNRKGICCSKSL